ncbi:uncharacterized protein [Drosophila pseudoobscura]|uniref:Uncharacterized protein n=1 Tax=Drosophila pseudoobscura pseudoobscura TaxID=46245 RepID=A0A6I8UHC8_DROPS|nr:uncharacterized protein LOC4815783 [Drosophila pseudoobscura]
MSNQKQTKTQAPIQALAQVQEADKRLTDEEARRHRAKLRFSYGNMISNANLNRMRNRLSAAVTEAGPTAAVSAAAATAAAAAEAAAAAVVVSEGDGAAKKVSSAGAPDTTLRRISSTFEHVCNVKAGCCVAQPHEDTEADGREERAEVLICSQMMPQAPSLSVLSPVPEPQKMKDLPLDSSHLDGFYSRPLGESRAIERWQQLSSTVTSLFSARRYTDDSESPVAKTRRLREQREMLQIFTRPFLMDQQKREFRD